MENQNSQVQEIESTAVEIVENNERSNVLAQVQTFDLVNHIPDLKNSQVMPIDLTSEYWTPDKVGEEKRVFFVELGICDTVDQETGENIALECAFFLEQDNNGEIKQIRNGSKKLVGALISNRVKYGTPLLITYMGKKKNRTNSRLSDQWSIKPLRVNI